jgi:transcription-repair coupling factor (superfamily II helicase)
VADAGAGDRPAAALAVALLREAEARGGSGVVRIEARPRDAEDLAALAAALAPGVLVVHLPDSDSLPYDRAPPSPRSAGLRAAAAVALAGRAADRPVLAVASAEAAARRLPDPARLRAASVRVAVGDRLDEDELRRALLRAGHVEDDRVDEPGEVAFRGGVLDLFPAAAGMPVRIDRADGRITAIRRYDPVSQRTVEELAALDVPPATEAPAAGDADAPPADGPAIERALASGGATTLLGLLPDAAVSVADGADDRVREAAEAARDAFDRRRAGAASLPEPDALWLTPDAWARSLAGRATVPGPAAEVERGPRFADRADGGRAADAHLRGLAEAGYRIALAGAERDLPALARRVRRALGREPVRADAWEDVEAAPAGAALLLRAPAEAGFVDPPRLVALFAAADLLGTRAARDEGGPSGPVPGFDGLGLRIGDAVVHEDHGMAALEGLEPVPDPEGGEGEAVRLRFAAGGTLLVPVADVGRLHRYGADADAVRLDRLDGTSWAARRAEAEAAVEAAARRLVRTARERARAEAPRLVPPRAAYERLAARFPFAETADQARAIADTLADLASGRPMDRLVCGDVGYGKTEVMLRAAAAAALAGRQVAVAAPTTVLVRQHLRTLERRFAGTGVRVAQLSRLAGAAEARAARVGLADGSVRVVVGTHALAARGVRFADLGLLVVDEEQRFGARQKEALRRLGGPGLHRLVLTATPIPRTLQSAMAGLQAVSVIATPPARRRPVRTVLGPFDPEAVRAALLRERDHGGQSFVVCPRIEDLGPMAERLRGLAPGLEVVVAHGRRPTDETDRVMVEFADGVGDVLLSTAIVESGLDVPRANTIVVWRPDRFGLAQLHQLRGRVGRGRRRGAAILATDPDGPPMPEGTAKRLRTLVAMDRLGAGFALSARDLDLRGAGDPLGDEQAGHAGAIGIGLFRELLDRAMAAARGEPPPEAPPAVVLGAAGRIPAEHVPQPDLRLDLYDRLARADGDGVERIAEEVEDRFGPTPGPLRLLLLAARLRRLCARAGVVRLEAGPQAVALVFAPGAAARARAAEPALSGEGDRLIDRTALADPAARAEHAAGLLERLARSVRRRAA